MSDADQLLFLTFKGVEDMESENMTGTIKKNRLIGLIKGIGLKIYEVFKDYPVTMLGIIVAALLGAILEEVYNNNTEEILEKN